MGTRLAVLVASLGTGSQVHSVCDFGVLEANPEPQGNLIIIKHQLCKRNSELSSLKKTSCDRSKRKIDSKWDHVLFRICAASREGPNPMTGLESGTAQLQALYIVQELCPLH